MTYIRLIEKACPDVDFKREIFLGDIVHLMSRNNPEPIGVIVKLTANKVKVLKFSSGEIVSFQIKNISAL